MYSFFKLSYSLNIFPLILFNWDSLNVSGMVCILNKKSNSASLNSNSIHRGSRKLPLGLA